MIFRNAGRWIGIVFLAAMLAFVLFSIVGP